MVAGEVSRPSSRALVSILAAAVMLLAVLALYTPSQANAELRKFCPPSSGYGWLDPAWTGIYRCDGKDAESGYGMDRVYLNTWERAGCVDYADVWHNLIDSWACYPKYTTMAYYTVRRDGGWYRGVIRNNNVSSPGLFTGYTEF
jgi:hypothetical protein